MDPRESKSAASDRRGASPVIGPRWFARIAEAQSQASLIRTCRRFLLSLRPADLARLPLACRPIPLEDAADLSAYALQLVRYHCEVEEASPLLLRMASFFAHANVRMAKILRRMNDDVAAETILARIGPPRGEPDPDAPPPGRERPNAGVESE